MASNVSTHQLRKSFFKKHGKQVDEKSIDDAVTFADANKDGKIDINEFINAFLSSKSLLGNKNKDKDKQKKAADDQKDQIIIQPQ